MTSVIVWDNRVQCLSRGTQELASVAQANVAVVVQGWSDQLTREREHIPYTSVSVVIRAWS